MPPEPAPGSATFALPTPHADQWQQRQQCVIEVRALAQVGGVGRERQVVEDRDIAGGGRFRALGRGRYSVVA